MTNIQKKTGATIAATAAALLMAGTISLTTTPAQAATVKCSGINSCKGTSECKTSQSSCKGMNSCKGQGWITQATATACKSAGGTVVNSGYKY